MEIVEKAYAKINLCLDCKNKREDGYHELESVILPLQFHDSIEFSFLPNGSTDDFVTCDDFSMRISKYNLCHKMIDVLREKYQFNQHFNIKIHKNILLQAGLGGGSADAAAVLRCLIKKLNLNLSDGEIKDICMKVGSDCYFQFYNKPALVKGKGDNLSFFDFNKKDYLVLLIGPNSGNSTEEVFNEADKVELIHGDAQKCLNLLEEGNLSELKECIFNSLYLPACKLNSSLEKMKQDIDEYDFELSSMTGSGSCFFVISKNKKLILKAAKELYKKGYQTEITKFL